MRSGAHGNGQSALGVPEEVHAEGAIVGLAFGNDARHHRRRLESGVQLVGTVAFVAKEHRVKTAIEQQRHVALDVVDQPQHSGGGIEQRGPGQRWHVGHCDEGLVDPREDGAKTRHG